MYAIRIDKIFCAKILYNRGRLAQNITRINGKQCTSSDETRCIFIQLSEWPELYLVDHRENGIGYQINTHN